MLIPDSKLDLFAVRSLLFLPASNPRAIMHARNSDADLVILDLEDAVKPEDKAAGRAAAVEALGQQWRMPVAVRINSQQSEWHGEDMIAVMTSSPDAIVVPRAAGKDEVAFVRNQTGKPVLAMIETAKGIMSIHETAREAAALIAGTNDLAADLRLPLGAGRKPLHMALQLIILAARAAGIAAFDGVYNSLDDDEGFIAEAEDGHIHGFDGKSLIHPRQIPLCNAAFSPSDEEIARAERLVAAATGGAERFEGQMIERMHVETAKRVLERR
jgi:citrate lyase subunit beta/citryl-CoA lyase